MNAECGMWNAEWMTRVEKAGPAIPHSALESP